MELLQTLDNVISTNILNDITDDVSILVNDNFNKMISLKVKQEVENAKEKLLKIAIDLNDINDLQENKLNISSDLFNLIGILNKKEDDQDKQYKKLDNYYNDSQELRKAKEEIIELKNQLISRPKIIKTKKIILCQYCKRRECMTTKSGIKEYCKYCRY